AVAVGVVLRVVRGVVVVDSDGPRQERLLRLRLGAASRAAERAFTAAERGVAASTPSSGTAAAHRRGAPFECGRAVGLDDALTHVGDVRNVPDAFLSGDAAEIGRAGGEARRRFRRARGAAAASFLRAGSE